MNREVSEQQEVVVSNSYSDDLWSGTLGEFLSMHNLQSNKQPILDVLRTDYDVRVGPYIISTRVQVASSTVRKVLVELADSLDSKGLRKEADMVDGILGTKVYLNDSWMGVLRSKDSLDALVILADSLDSKGLIREANDIDDLLNEISQNVGKTEQDIKPFGNSLLQEEQLNVDIKYLNGQWKKGTITRDEYITKLYNFNKRNGKDDLTSMAHQYLVNALNEQNKAIEILGGDIETSNWWEQQL